MFIWELIAFSKCDVSCSMGGGLISKSCPTRLWPHGLEPTRLPCPWKFSSKNTWVSCHFQEKEIATLTSIHDSEIEPASPACQADSLPLSHLEVHTTSQGSESTPTSLNFSRAEEKNHTLVTGSNLTSGFCLFAFPGWEISWVLATLLGNNPIWTQVLN